MKTYDWVTSVYTAGAFVMKMGFPKGADMKLQIKSGGRYTQSNFT
jgi:hypothetical protein